MKEDIETLKHAIEEGEEQQARDAVSTRASEEARAAFDRLEECRSSGWKLCPTVIRCPFRLRQCAPRVPCMLAESVCGVRLSPLAGD
jgi:hypothetical protein